MKIQGMRLYRLAWINHVATQGSTKQVRQVMDSLRPKKELGREDLLRDFKRNRGR